MRTAKKALSPKSNTAFGALADTLTPVAAMHSANAAAANHFFIALSSFYLLYKSRKFLHFPEISSLYTLSLKKATAAEGKFFPFIDCPKIGCGKVANATAAC